MAGDVDVYDHVLESITGHLFRRMLEHYSHIRIDAKRQARDALDVQRGRVLPTANKGGEPQDPEIDPLGGDRVYSIVRRKPR